MSFAALRDAAGREGLALVGWFHADPADAVPGGAGTLVLLGPGGPEMWAAFSAGTEARDGAPHPLDRWSWRVVGAIAAASGGRALFPFGGPPWHPFQHWAARGEGARKSPALLQVSAARGMWLSYRGAIAFDGRLDLPARHDTDPCVRCPAPCRTACPVGALSGDTYDVAACVAHVTGPDGAACRTGCLVRKSCPAGRGLDLPEAERRFHMDAFLRANA